MTLSDLSGLANFQRHAASLRGLSVTVELIITEYIYTT